MRRGVVVAAFIASVWLANYLTSHYGMQEVGLGYMATAGTFAAGLALGLRDFVQDAVGRWGAVAAIAAGAALTAFLSPSLALASGAAFLVSELADTLVYTPLRDRNWSTAVLASNTIGAFLDTVIFLWLAQSVIHAPIWSSVPGQMLGKVVWATLPVIVLRQVVRGAVSRQPVRA